MTDHDERHMRHALALAARGLGRVWPNPSVGCVVVKNGRVIGRGRTADGGRPHAETQALSMAGSSANGATAYVTLEPCAHQGETPPCVDALVTAGIKRCVVAAQDPDPRVSGRGLQNLRAAGVEVDVGCLQAEAIDLQKGFLSRVQSGRPSLTLKLASTLDGRIATASGESQWITGPDARKFAHLLRSRFDAVLIGAGTARADDPKLTVREAGLAHNPIRVVASRNLQLPVDSNLGRSAGDIPVWIICAEGAENSTEAKEWSAAGAEIIPVAMRRDQIGAKEMLQALGERGLTRVFCEGGGVLAASLLEDEMVDELIVFTAGKVLGAEGYPSVGPLGLSALGSAPEFNLKDTRVIGADVCQIWSAKH